MRNSDGHWEMFDDYVLDFALDRAGRGFRVAVVTLVEVEGSSPWRPGAQMAVAETGQWVGYLSGGCIERAVVAEAAAAFEEGRSRRVRYGRGSRYMDIRLPCGGAIELVIDIGVARAELEHVDALLRSRRKAVLEIPDAGGPLTPAGMAGPFLRTYLPRRRLVVAGIGPVAVQLARLARTSGFEVTLASPDEETRRALGTMDVERLPIGSTGTGALRIDGRTAVVVAFHDHDRELSLLPAIMRSEAFYVGAMGSARTHRARLERLKADGFGADSLARLRGPAGILPHARGGTEIAVSILAEILQSESESVAEIGLLAIAPSGSEQADVPAPAPVASTTSLAECSLSRNAVR